MIGSDTIHDLFGLQQAEQEIAWLTEALVVPAFIMPALNMQSVAMIGNSGSGKSAFRLGLFEQDQKNRLTVVWLPKPLQSIDKMASTLLIQDLLQTIALGLVKNLGQHVVYFKQADPDLQKEVADLISTIVAPITLLKILARRLSKGLSEEGQALVTELLFPADRPNPYDENNPQHLLDALCAYSHELGYTQIWVIIDGLEQLEAEIETANHTMHTLCSLLHLYEIPELSFKMFIPETFAPILQRSRIVERKRLNIVYLHWDEATLIQVLERRLQILFEEADYRLEKIAKPEYLLPLLRKQPLLPRAWLDVLKIIVQQLYAQGTSVALSTEYIEALNTSIHPVLSIRDERIFMSGKELTHLSPQSDQILRYLMQHRGHICSREEIYYCAIRGMRTIPHKSEAGYEDPLDWRSVVDTSISRLRTALEEDSNGLVRIETIRSKGIKLL